ncbi:hypothetical protein [Yersinia ruckeri]|uniref:hypothetical protein n=1 Tax=Yersinia ruckeri TaxID=29486 RepID=UPI000BDEE114|nr:hypothetical protein [Yersinia ruckeri]MCK8540306.1 hypothetical protein [Yersinia ruckeri]MCK8572387.1 hypothetical protein [Yersinia ruckeri]MCK8575932.1 hypothetical protein [Yersinia ruckeri]MCK8578836.1 hypothetical protein [Yersinia ruckeri]MCK8582447.1 hypothetical protein [Yersinia ruckeri]
MAIQASGAFARQNMLSKLDSFAKTSETNGKVTKSTAQKMASLFKEVKNTINSLNSNEKKQALTNLGKMATTLEGQKSDMFDKKMAPISQFMTAIKGAGTRETTSALDKGFNALSGHTIQASKYHQ